MNTMKRLFVIALLLVASSASAVGTGTLDLGNTDFRSAAFSSGSISESGITVNTYAYITGGTVGACTGDITASNFDTTTGSFTATVSGLYFVMNKSDMGVYGSGVQRADVVVSAGGSGFGAENYGPGTSGGAGFSSSCIVFLPIGASVKPNLYTSSSTTGCSMRMSVIRIR